MILDGRKSLNKHIATTHTGVLSFWCRKCYAGFRTELQLKRHSFTMHPPSPPQNNTAEAGESAPPTSQNEGGSSLKQAPSVQLEVLDPFDAEWPELVPPDVPQTHRQAGSSAQHAIERQTVDDILGLESPAENTDEMDIDTGGQQTDNAAVEDSSQPSPIAREGLSTSLGGGNRDVFCPNCNGPMSNQRALAQHMRSYHTGPQNVKCPLCPGTFNFERQLSFHMSTVHRAAASRLSATCPICGAVLGDKWKLSRHIGLCHSGDQSHHCDVCTARFNTARQLLMHKKRVHN